MYTYNNAMQVLSLKGSSISDIMEMSGNYTAVISNSYGINMSWVRVGYSCKSLGGGE